ncbi:hypothetical protein K525DRAFT_282625 [Schizophyllum commune Loenen D]|nr:hypothetical protein K525DRAFT_282625 [Schizophyllum commune Loenen D]
MGVIGLMHERVDLRSLPLEADGASSGVTDRGDEMEKSPVGRSFAKQLFIARAAAMLLTEWTIDLMDGQCRLHVHRLWAASRTRLAAHGVSRSMYADAVGPLESAQQTRFERYAGALLGWRLLPETVGGYRRFNRCMLLFGSSRGMFTELTAMRRTLGLWAWRRLPTTGITFEDTTCFGAGGSGSCAPKCVLRARASGITA